MALAATNTRGIAPATVNGLAIPEIGVAPDTALDDRYDVHFGINLSQTDKPALYAGFNPLNARDAALLLWDGLGPRVIEMKRRGGRAAEHDFDIHFGAEPPTALGDSGLTTALVDNFNRKIAVTKPNYPASAKVGGAAVAGAKGYTGATKDLADGMQGGLRWSKAALEYAISSGQGHVHFHLTGMGEVSGILDKTGGYGFNVTSRELRYLRRCWMRFQNKVTFYNGYTAGEKAVRVMPPWVPMWELDSATTKCRRCNQDFSRIAPIRWRHHCRLCGENVCDDCSQHEVRLRYPVQRPNSTMETGLVRICDKCHRPAAPSDFT
jgi:hypothetical protein